MLEQVFRRQSVIQRVRAGPLGSVVDHFVGDMLGRGHARMCIVTYVREAELFGLWLSQQHLDFQNVTEAVISKYLLGPGRRRPETTTPAGLGRLLLTLRSMGLSPPAITEPRSPVERVTRWCAAAKLSEVERRRVQPDSSAEHGAGVGFDVGAKQPDG